LELLKTGRNTFTTSLQWNKTKNPFLKFHHSVSVNKEYTPHEGDITCSGVAPRRGKIITNATSRWYHL